MVKELPKRDYLIVGNQKFLPSFARANHLLAGSKRIEALFVCHGLFGICLVRGMRSGIGTAGPNVDDFGQF